MTKQPTREMIDRLYHCARDMRVRGENENDAHLMACAALALENATGDIVALNDRVAEMNAAAAINDPLANAAWSYFDGLDAGCPREDGECLSCGAKSDKHRDGCDWEELSRCIKVFGDSLDELTEADMRGDGLTDEEKREIERRGVSALHYADMRLCPSPVSRGGENACGCNANGGA